MDVNAKWRDEAFKRIEKIRKGDFTIKLKRHGKEIVGKKVEIELVKHSFKFGAALNAKDIVNNSKEYRNFKSAFNLVVLKNDLKIKRWSKKKKRKVTLQALDILKRDEIDVKGHVLIWPGLSYLTPAVKENVNNPEKVKKIIFNHVRNILKETNGKVSHWDVVNEAYTNQDLQKITGSEKILYQGFRIAKNNYPDIERYTNEYGIISKGGIDIKKQQWYYKYIQRIDDFTGGLVDGIGIQCHIGSDLTAPHKVIEILDFYAALNKKISISEFTMDIQENAIREKYTRDFIIAAFSHPNVSEFLFWGCTQDEKNTVDIFKQNGDLGIMGKAYFDLVFDKWKTRLIEKTDRSGKILGRGFYGIYKYSFSDGGKQITGRFKVSPNKSNEIIIDVK
jgi:GH35 family endo-1,4-beta-xylanase